MLLTLSCAVLQTRCYRGQHLPVVIISCILLLLYTGGFPLFALVRLTRAFGSEQATGLFGFLWRNFTWFRDNGSMSSNQEADALEAAHDSGKSHLSSPHDGKAIPATSAELTPEEKVRQDSFGFLYLGLRPDHRAVYLGEFAITLWMVLIAALVTSNVELQLFLLGLATLMRTSNFIVQLPYLKWHVNVRKVVLGLVALAHTTLMLGLQHPDHYVLFGIFAGLFGVVVVAAMGRYRMLRRAGGSRIAQAPGTDVQVVLVQPVQQSSQNTTSTDNTNQTDTQTDRTSTAPRSPSGTAAT